MRIRTIKPEFWTDEKIARLSEPSALLAIGLLNYADDDGYFNANEALIRAAVFPLREPSLSVARMMSELVDIGYIRIGRTKDGRNIGLVVHFRDHQQISHPKASKLAHLVTFTDASGDPEDIVRERSGKLPEASGSCQDASGLNREQGTGNREGNREVPLPALAGGLSEADRLGWLKRKRAWMGSPADQSAWLGMLKDFGPQAVDTAVEHLRRANPAKKYVDAGDVQALIEAGRQSVAEPELVKPPELMSLVEGIAQEVDPERKRDLTRCLEVINARGWTWVRDRLRWSQTRTRERLESALLMNPAAPAGVLEIVAKADAETAP